MAGKSFIHYSTIFYTVHISVLFSILAITRGFGSTVFAVPITANVFSHFVLQCMSSVFPCISCIIFNFLWGQKCFCVRLSSYDGTRSLECQNPQYPQSINCVLMLILKRFQVNRLCLTQVGNHICAGSSFRFQQHDFFSFDFKGHTFSNDFCSTVTGIFTNILFRFTKLPFFNHNKTF